MAETRTVTVKTPWREGGKYREFDVTLPKDSPDEDAYAYVVHKFGPVGKTYPQGVDAERQLIQQMDAQTLRQSPPNRHDASYRVMGEVPRGQHVYPETQQGPTDLPSSRLAGSGGALNQISNAATQFGANVLNSLVGNEFTQGYKRSTDKRAIEDSRMYHGLTRESADAGRGAFEAELLAFSALPVKGKYPSFKAGVPIGASQPVSAETPYMDMTGNAILGTAGAKVFGSGMGYIGNVIKEARGGMKGAVGAFQEWMGGKAKTDAEAGEMAGAYMKELKDMGYQEVSALYKAAMKHYGPKKDIPMRPYIELLRKEQDEWQPGSMQWKTIQRHMRGMEKMLQRNQVLGGRNQMIGINQLNNHMVTLNREYRSVEYGKEAGDLGMIKKIQGILHGAVKGEKAHALLGVAQRRNALGEQGAQLYIKGKEVSLDKYLRKMHSRDVVDQVVNKGTVGNLSSTKDIFLNAWKNLDKLHQRSAKRKGQQAWDDLRAREFADKVKRSHEDGVMNPDKFRELWREFVASGKADIMYTKEEQEIIKILGEVNESGLWSMAKSVAGGPRFEASARLLREVVKRGLQFLRASSETKGFSVKMGNIIADANKSGYKKIAQHIGERMPFRQMGAIITGR